MAENQNPAEELKNQIDSAIETKANEAAEVASENLEAKTAEVESKLEKMAMEAKADRELMQKSIDELAAQRKSVFGIGSTAANHKEEQLQDIYV